RRRAARSRAGVGPLERRRARRPPRTTGPVSLTLLRCRAEPLPAVDSEPDPLEGLLLIRRAERAQRVVAPKGAGSAQGAGSEAVPEIETLAADRERPPPGRIRRAQLAECVIAEPVRGVEPFAADVQGLLPRGLIYRPGGSRGRADRKGQANQDARADADAPCAATGHFALPSCAGFPHPR